MADVAARRWNVQYKDWSRDTDKPKIGRMLDQLGECPDPDVVDSIIGNTSWTRVHCDNCGSDADVVELGQEPDYESCTASVCLTCLQDAVLLLDPNNIEIVVD